jgi:hypothetical protein
LGASSHFEPDRRKYQSFRSIPPKLIKATGRIFYATGQGDIPFTICNGTKTHKIMLKDTLYVPTMPIPLISISHIVKSGYHLTFGNNCTKLSNPKGNIIFEVPEKNSLYSVSVATNSSTAKRTTTALTSMTPFQLHHCLGHIHGPATT